MSLITTAIVSSCIGITDPQQQQACEKGLIALSMENNTNRQIDAFEQSLNKDALNDVNDIFGKRGVTAISGSLYIIKVIHDRGISFGLPTLGLCDNMSSSFGNEMYLMRLEWRL